MQLTTSSHVLSLALLLLLASWGPADCFAGAYNVSFSREFNLTEKLIELKEISERDFELAMLSYFDVMQQFDRSKSIRATGTGIRSRQLAILLAVMKVFDYSIKQKMVERLERIKDCPNWGSARYKAMLYARVLLRAKLTILDLTSDFRKKVYLLIAKYQDSPGMKLVLEGLTKGQLELDCWWEDLLEFKSAQWQWESHMGGGQEEDNSVSPGSLDSAIDHLFQCEWSSLLSKKLFIIEYQMAPLCALIDHIVKKWVLEFVPSHLVESLYEEWGLIDEDLHEQATKLDSFYELTMCTGICLRELKLLVPECKASF